MDAAGRRRSKRASAINQQVSANEPRRSGRLAAIDSSSSPAIDALSPPLRATKFKQSYHAPRVAKPAKAVAATAGSKEAAIQSLQKVLRITLLGSTFRLDEVFLYSHTSVCPACTCCYPPYCFNMSACGQELGKGEDALIKSGMCVAGEHLGKFVAVKMQPRLVPGIKNQVVEGVSSTVDPSAKSSFSVLRRKR